MRRDGWCKTNRRHVPARAVLLASVLGFAGVMAAILSPSIVFAFLVNASGAIIVFIYLTIVVVRRCAAARARAAGVPPPTLPMWLFPWLGYSQSQGCSWYRRDGRTPSHRAEFWTSTITIAVTLLAYLVFRRGRASVPSMAPAVRQE